MTFTYIHIYSYTYEYIYENIHKIYIKYIFIYFTYIHRMNIHAMLGLIWPPT